MSDPDDALVPLQMAAEIAGKSTRTVRRWVKQGDVSWTRDKRRRILVDRTTIPGVEAEIVPPPTNGASRASEETEGESERRHGSDVVEHETFVTEPNRDAQLFAALTRILHQNYQHTEAFAQMALGDVRADKAALYEEMKRVRAENARLHHAISEMRQAVEEAADKTVEREMKIEQWARDNAREDQNRSMAILGLRTLLGDRLPPEAGQFLDAIEGGAPQQQKKASDDDDET